MRNGCIDGHYAAPWYWFLGGEGLVHAMRSALGEVLKIGRSNIAQLRYTRGPPSDRTSLNASEKSGVLDDPAASVITVRQSVLLKRLYPSKSVHLQTNIKNSSTRN